MGKHFGDMAYLRGIVTFKISPFEQRAFAGAVTKGIPNFFTRGKSSLYAVVPPFVLGYLWYNLIEKRHEYLMRKNPADYVNDV